MIINSKKCGLLSMYNQFLLFCALFAVIATYGNLIDVKSALQGYAVVGCEVPWYSVIAGRCGGLLSVRPYVLPVEVVDIDGEGCLAVRTVVVDDKGCSGGCRVVA